MLSPELPMPIDQILSFPEVERRLTAVGPSFRLKAPPLLAPVVATALVHAALVAAYVAAFRGDVSALVCADRDRIGAAPFEVVTVGFPRNGYDGQFYYAIAQDPWHRHRWGTDAPAARHLRILYPAVCWALSAGDPHLLLWVMPAVNLVAVVGLGWLGARLARRYALSPWLGFLLPLVVNAGMLALRDLTDPLSVLAAVGLLTAWLERSKRWATALWAAAAVFSSEMNVALLAVLLVLAARNRAALTGCGLAAVLGLWLAWVGVLSASYGARPFVPLRATFDTPLTGLHEFWRQVVHAPALDRATVLRGLGLVTLALGSGLCLYVMTRNSDPAVVAVMVAGLLLTALARVGVYESPWQFTRLFVWVPIGVWLGSVQTRCRWPVFLLLPGAVWSFAAVAQVWLA
jgi:hypothetical protein